MTRVPEAQEQCLREPGAARAAGDVLAVAGEMMADLPWREDQRAP